MNYLAAAFFGSRQGLFNVVSLWLSLVVLFGQPLAQAQQAAKTANTLSTTTIRVLNYNLDQPSEQDFFWGLLDKALSQTVTQYGPYELQHLYVPYQLQHLYVPYQQNRIAMLINRGDVLEVMHTMASKNRENSLSAIKIPLMMGMLGHRMLLIKASRLDEFAKIREPKQLKKLIACQGIDWPDSDILEANGYAIARVTNEDAMLAMLEYKRCDYYPRGISEIELEQSNNKYGALAQVPHIILRYPAPVYYFVAKDNSMLAERIEMGLQKIQQSGEFNRYISSHTATSFLFPLSQWDNHLFFDLHNPTLGEFNPNLEFWKRLGEQEPAPNH